MRAKQRKEFMHGGLEQGLRPDKQKKGSLVQLSSVQLLAINKAFVVDKATAK